MEAYECSLHGGLLQAKPVHYEVFKNVSDRVLALVGIMLLMPVFLLVIVLIKLDTPGTILFRAKRAGKNGKPFRMLKFRTMIMDAEDKGGRLTANNDERITRIGKYLRQSKIDELPQLFNVLRGEMSIIGPRPEYVEYVEQYDELDKMILSVKPGITDFSSIEFINMEKILGNIDADRVYEEKVLHHKNALRRRYVLERGYLVDFKILSLTIMKIFSKFWSSRSE